MSAEPLTPTPPPRLTLPPYEDWWENQVRSVLPRWMPGTRRSDWTDGFAWWPLPPDDLAVRLEYLASQNLVPIAPEGRPRWK